MATYIWATFGKIWANLNSNIWSPWSHRCVQERQISENEIPFRMTILVTLLPILKHFGGLELFNYVVGTVYVVVKAGD